MKKNILISILAAVAMSACAHINSVSLTPIPAQRSHPVKAEVSKTIFLALNFDNDYINPLVDDLKSQCPNGVVSGILTKDETTSYVLVFVKHVTASGFCSVAQASAQQVHKGKKL